MEVHSLHAGTLSACHNTLTPEACLPLEVPSIVILTCVCTQPYVKGALRDLRPKSHRAHDSLQEDAFQAHWKCTTKVAAWQHYVLSNVVVAERNKQ